MAVSTQTTSERETASLIASDKVEDTSVRNLDGEYLGSIKRVMIDKVSGQVRYAVMSFGGFLGIGEQYHPLPWNTLKYDTTQDAYVVQLDRRQLEGAPTIAEDERVDWADEEWNRRVHEHYNVPPYWV